MSNKAKIELTEKPERVGKAWKVNIKDFGMEFIPDTFFMGYNPGTKKAEIECYILDQKNIPYKV
jgi:hypothetical protein